MHTEKEANKLWCPQKRIGEQGGNCPIESNSRCIASKCAMWRWSISPYQANEINARGKAGYVAKGYCGLAGKP